MMAMPCLLPFDPRLPLHPTMSSPNEKDVEFVYCCWAEAGMLATVVAVHIATRAPQIFLEMLMVACLVPAAEPSAAAFARGRHEFPDRVINQRRNLAPPLIWINEGRNGIKSN